MKQEKASNKALKHIVCCVVLLIIFVITFTKVNAQNENNQIVTSDTQDVVPLKPQLNESLLELKRINIGENNTKLYEKPRIIEKDNNYYIKEYESTLLFFSEAFGYDIELVKNDLIKRNEAIKTIESTNIASLLDDNNKLIVYPNTEYGIIEYFYDLVDNNTLERNRKIEPCSKDSEYVEKLIMYYTNIYTNVDRSIALSIGAAESGYYKVKYMLNQNNIYGGMSNYGLIKHDNIELGVLSYIRMLSNNYFGKGLTTVEQIGYIYCPTTNEYGQKYASSHWINLVNKAKVLYDNYNKTITINDIINY